MTETLTFKSFRDISRKLTIVENDLEGADKILSSLKVSKTPVIGITGPPGAGKSTLVSKIIDALIKRNKRVAVIAVDPSSPFTSGSLLGDRVRMQEFSSNPNVYIRSVAARGALGGLSAKIIEITDVIKSFEFDFIIVETVGVGQSEIEIAGLADFTLVVLVPESGDEVQSIKAGIMEIADAFIVNKADREGADYFARHLQSIAGSSQIPVCKTVAITGEGLSEIMDLIEVVAPEHKNKVALLARKAWKLIQEKRMKDLSLQQLQQELEAVSTYPDFNLYKFAESKLRSS
ncbi:MAG: methylmalonyl Co-A mutase-associated GTPase MeaB [Sphingobacteriaceae bacterium]|nr:methylmalonyl Co-A mutase-associated GTPase MeaB [Sphingobacteriaceae bacterium]